MNEKRIEELRAMCDTATPGPWIRERWSIDTVNERVVATANMQLDAAFIAAARTALPELLDEVERLETEAEEAKKKKEITQKDTEK